jgi:hypothetical protein
VFDIPLTRASRGLSLRRKKKETTKSAPNVKWGRNKKKKKE